MSEIFISENAGEKLIEYLKDIGHSVTFVEPGNPRQVYPAISKHPDIYMCKLGTDPEAFVYEGERSMLECDYPGNIRYNAVVIGDYFIHNLKYTDKSLLKVVAGLKKIHVKQGYTKCNVAAIDESRMITSDRGIANSIAAAAPELNVLLVSESQVLLPGFPEGFIGGACGRVGQSIIFNGNLEEHSDFEKICQFIGDAGLETVYFKEYPLTDIGSIIERKA
ncbi:MAG: hypothetical protein PHW03_07365 [Eubacteriales bacterium]|nr:hypothetical protein [Eubacteriales bacterium]MDD4390605.1 hypothetical protein [Eubacteriales bacterium]